MADNIPATKRDLVDMARDLKQFIMEREISGIRWMVGTQLAYFAITFSAVWVLVAHWKP